MEHTPGPWTIDAEVIWCADDLPPFCPERSDEEHDANMRLIAAAPDLLLACERRQLYEAMKYEYYRQVDLGMPPSEGWQEISTVDLHKAERIAKESCLEAIAKAKREL